MKITDKIRLAYGSTLMDDGYTLWNDKSTKYKGFVVGGMAHESVCERDDCVKFSNLFVEYQSLANTFRQSSGDTYAHPQIGIGTWVDEKTFFPLTKICFDVVRFFESEQDAIDMATKLGEKAYYDIANNKSIYLPLRPKVGTKHNQ